MAEGVERLRTDLPGWKACYRLSQRPGIRRSLDEGLRHRLRAIQLKHGKRRTTMYRELRNLGAAGQVARRVAGNSRCGWRNSNGEIERVSTTAYFDKLGVPRLSSPQRLEPPGAEPHAGWYGRGTAYQAVPYADVLVPLCLLADLEIPSCPRVFSGLEVYLEPQ